MVFDVGSTYSFDKVKKVKEINDAIVNTSSTDYNCSNFAFSVNGFNQDPAFAGKNDGISQMEQAASILNGFSNIQESETSIGNIVSFGYSEECMRREAPYQNVSNLYTPRYTDEPAHYGIVVLKSPDGKNVSKIIEKPGSGPIRITDYQNYQTRTFIPRPQTNDSTPFYKP